MELKTHKVVDLMTDRVNIAFTGSEKQCIDFIGDQFYYQLCILTEEEKSQYNIEN